ncbi:Ig-like domain repeat protein [Corynebacterium gerontici]|uniref:Bacterial Ig-like domain-containing protein n=1 Tax=Corynebacterium gerontici TaxID=2079234 RepID=A0A3G6J4J6_9CORY|nr:Ig-like domain repeat protein [Corynebacterium gerontici]AZA10984.1 hypothetical protein CGERO_03320 [Corynebacterium gerontici]
MKMNKIAAACCTFAVGCSLVVPTASAATAEASHQDSNSIYTRTISDTEATVGQTITYSQTFTTTSASSKDYIYSWSNNVDTCLEFVQGSATLNSEKIADSQVVHVPGKTTINAPSNYWTFTQAAPHAFSLSYRLAPSCAGKTLESGFWYKYGSWFGTKTYAPNLFNGGPAITVNDNSKAASTTVLSPLPEWVAKDQQIPLVASVTAEGAAHNGGTVTFANNGREICTSAINNEGLATCDWQPAEKGEASITAAFSGNDTIAESASAPMRTKVISTAPKKPTDLRFTEEQLNNATQTIITGKATPGATVEALAPGGNRCVDTADENGEFSCNLGFLPAGQERGVAVTESFDGVKSEVATLVADVNEGGSSSFDSFLSFLRKLGFDIQGFFQRLLDPNTWVSLGSSS